MVTTWSCENCGASCDEEDEKCEVCGKVSVCTDCGPTCDGCLQLPSGLKKKNKKKRGRVGGNRVAK